jgi:hypothetical protein
MNRALDQEEDTAKKVSSARFAPWSESAQYNTTARAEIAELEDRLAQEKMETTSGEWQGIEEVANQR